MLAFYKEKKGVNLVNSQFFMCYITNNKENELSLQKLKKIFAYEKDNSVFLGCVDGRVWKQKQFVKSKQS